MLMDHEDQTKFIVQSRIEQPNNREKPGEGLHDNPIWLPLRQFTQLSLRLFFNVCKNQETWSRRPCMQEEIQLTDT